MNRFQSQLQISSILLSRLVIMGVLCLGWSSTLDAQSRHTLVYHPAPVDNPLKGLVPYQGTSNRFPHSMEFNYLSLAELMTGNHEFDWRPLEALLDDVQSRGNQTIFRIYLEYPKKLNAIPQFLIDAGLKVHQWKNTNTAPLPPAPVITPDYEDERLRTALVQFIQAMGKKYDGDSRIGYVTAGLLGTWGEWHTYPRDDLWASKETQAIILDAYESAFQKTPILLRYPAPHGHDTQTENASRPFGYHDDSFSWATLSTGRKKDDWYFQTCLAKAGALEKWKRHPIGGEVRPEVWGCCHDPNPCTPKGQDFESCRDALHVTWLMEQGIFDKQSNPERLKRAKIHAQKMGYEFYLSTVETNGDGQIMIEVENRGIAPFYHQGWPVYFRSLKKNSKLINSHFELTGILPGKSKSLVIHLRKEQWKEFETGFRIGIPNPMENGKPLRFANSEVNSEGWLTIRF